MAGPNTRLRWVSVPSSQKEPIWALSVGDAIQTGEPEVRAEVRRIWSGVTLEIYERTYGVLPQRPIHGYMRGKDLLSPAPVGTVQRGKALAEEYLIARYSHADLPWREGTPEYEKFVRPREERLEAQRKERERIERDQQQGKVPVPNPPILLELPAVDALALAEFLAKHYDPKRDAYLFKEVESQLRQQARQALNLVT